MLKIHFGELDSAEYGSSWFKYNYKPEWLKDELVQKMIKDVDNSTYVDGLVIDSPILGLIPPERLSGGVHSTRYCEPERNFLGKEWNLSAYSMYER